MVIGVRQTVHIVVKTRLCDAWRSIGFLFPNFPVPHFPVSHFQRPRPRQQGNTNFDLF